MRILVFATDMLPEDGFPTSGTAIRTAGLARALEHNGYEVEVLVPETATRGRKSPHRTYNFENQEILIQDYRPDAILCGHWPACGLRSKPNCPVILDLAGPHLLERHFQKSANQEGAVIGKLAAIALADYYIVSGPTQRLYFLSFITRAGVSQPENRIIEIPMALDPELPCRENRTVTDPRFIYGGVFLPWQDPTEALQTLVGTMDSVGKGSLKLIGGKHPNYELPTGVAEALFKKLSSHSRVSIEALQPYQQFVNSLMDADVALNLMSWNMERKLAIPVRSMNYLWAGVPLITDNYSDVSRMVEAYDAGWCVSPGELESTIEDILARPEQIKLKSKNALRLAAENLTWNHAAAKLRDALEQQGSILSKETDVDISRFDYPDISTNGKSVEQTFLSRINGLSEVCFCVATHAKEVAGEIIAEIYEVKTNQSICKEKLRVGTSDDNKWFTLRFPKQKLSAGSKYKLKLKGSDNIYVWAQNGTSYPLETVEVDGQKVETKSLCLKTLSRR